MCLKREGQEGKTRKTSGSQDRACFGDNTPQPMQWLLSMQVHHALEQKRNHHSERGVCGCRCRVATHVSIQELTDRQPAKVVSSAPNSVQRTNSVGRTLTHTCLMLLCGAGARMSSRSQQHLFEALRLAKQDTVQSTSPKFTAHPMWVRMLPARSHHTRNCIKSGPHPARPSCVPCIASHTVCAAVTD